MADAKQVKVTKGMKVRELPPQELFSGVVTEFRVDGETGDVQYKVTRQVFNEDGTPKMVEDRHGDSCDHDERGNPIMVPDPKGELEEDGKTVKMVPQNTGEMKNVRTEMVPVYEERFFVREQLEVVSE